MGVDLWDHEGNAAQIYADAGADMLEPPGAHALARMLGVPIRRDCRRMLGGAELARVNGVDVIFLRPSLPHVVEVARIYHELSERHLKRFGLDEDIERAADELAYHLRMPRPAFRGLLSVVGVDLQELAAPWPASQTGAALRLLEVTDTPGVVVTPQAVRVRGPEWGWPPERELRRLARCEQLPAGIDRLPIGDRRGGMLLMAA